MVQTGPAEAAPAAVHEFSAAGMNVSAALCGLEGRLVYTGPGAASLLAGVETLLQRQCGHGRLQFSEVGSATQLEVRLRGYFESVEKVSGDLKGCKTRQKT